jgi:hypothetical protein
VALVSVGIAREPSQEATERTATWLDRNFDGSFLGDFVVLYHDYERCVGVAGAVVGLFVSFDRGDRSLFLGGNISRRHVLDIGVLFAFRTFEAISSPFDPQVLPRSRRQRIIST